jgi:DNA polymerase I-like protein with 3'-5' exonuclease and polymerase domains
MVYRLRDTYSKVWDFKKELDQYGEAGGVVFNFMGRPIKYYDPTQVYMTFFNRLIQGSGSDILMASIEKIAGIPGISPLLAIHDEGVFEIDPTKISIDSAQAMIDNIMTDWDLGDVKLQIEGKVSFEWRK